MNTTGQLIACQGKLRYETRAAVEIAVRELSRARRERNGAAQSYRCPYCHAWHIGRPMQGKPKPKPRPAHRPRVEREPDAIDEFLNARHFTM